MPRIVRGQLALEIGERLRELGIKTHALPNYSNEAFELQHRVIISALHGELHRFDTLVKSCRAAKNSYPNYPALRKVLAEAGEQCYNIKELVEVIILEMNDGVDDWTRLGNRLLDIGQQLRLVSFVPPEKESTAAQA